MAPSRQEHGACHFQADELRSGRKWDISRDQLSRPSIWDDAAGGGKPVSTLGSVWERTQLLRLIAVCFAWARWTWNQLYCDAIATRWPVRALQRDADHSTERGQTRCHGVACDCGASCPLRVSGVRA